MIGVGDTLDVVGQIPWRQAVQTSVDEQGQLEINALSRPQPLKVPKHRCDVLVPTGSMSQSGGGIERRQVYSVSVVEPWHNQRNDQRMEHRVGH